MAKVCARWQVGRNPHLYGQQANQAVRQEGDYGTDDDRF
jgi:hypothetical protein